MGTGIQLPKFLGDREDFEVYHDEMHNSICHKKLDMVWSVEPHQDFPPSYLAISCQSEAQRRIIGKNNSALVYLKASFEKSSDLITFVADTIDKMPTNGDPVMFEAKYPNGQMHLVLKYLNNCTRSTETDPFLINFV